MRKNPVTERLAVCSWSLQPQNPGDLVSKVLTTGVPRVQLALDPLRERPTDWGQAPELLKRAGISIVSGMFGCVGEDYSTLETIQRTGGIAPDDTWEENWSRIQHTASLAERLGLKLVTFHAGFLPHDDSDPRFATLQQRLLRAAETFQSRGVAIALETGQETATELRHFLKGLDRANVGVNFDPANMLLYDKGDPVEALRVLAPWIRQVHLKDARRTRVPGTWGEEVALGTGEVNWREFFAALEEIGFTGDCCIEREAGDQRVVDVRTAREVVTKI